MGQWLLNLVSLYVPSITPARLLRVEFEVGELTQALVWIVAHSLNYIWKKRLSGKAAPLLDCQATLTADAALLADTRHRGTALNIQNCLL